MTVLYSNFGITPVSLHLEAKLRLRQKYFCVGVSPVFRGKDAIPITLKRLRNKHGLKWLRVSMSYHKFSNLREIFNGDLTGKLLKGITSRDYMDRPCNCQSQSKVNGKCMYGPNFRKSIVVYNCECVVCGSN